MIVRMESNHAALAALAEDVGRALIRYAGRLRIPTDGAVVTEIVPTPAVIAPSAAAPPAVAVSVDATSGRSEESGQVDVKLRRLGVSQKKALEAVRAAGETGTTANQVAAATGLTSTNTPRMLKTLAERGLVSSWGSNPTVWYVEPPDAASP